MSSNRFGRHFSITTWGESHGPAIGVVIDGCPCGLELSLEEIAEALQKRRPGSYLTSQRQESDVPEILSGVYEGYTTGAPISILIRNQDARSKDYDELKGVARPGHSSFTYHHKYGHFDHRGGGRASGRETACRVAAGAVAQKLLDHVGIRVCAFLESMGPLVAEIPPSFEHCHESVIRDCLFCPDEKVSAQMQQLLCELKEQGDSVGAVVGVLTTPLPLGLGDPVYEKLEANLAKALLGIPASKGFEIGEGFRSALQCGSEHNDLFVFEDQVKIASNRAGGTLGGISCGTPLRLRVPFKPASSIAKVQSTYGFNGEKVQIEIKGRHDPCIGVRGVPVVEAMVRLVLADAILASRLVRL